MMEPFLLLSADPSPSVDQMLRDLLTCGEGAGAPLWCREATATEEQVTSSLPASVLHLKKWDNTLNLEISACSFTQKARSTTSLSSQLCEATDTQSSLRSSRTFQGRIWGRGYKTSLALGDDPNVLHKNHIFIF